MKNNDLLAWMQDKGRGTPPTQAFAFGGIANPVQQSMLRRIDKEYLAERQKELDAYEEQRLAYNSGLTKYQDEVYKPYQAQADAYNTAAQKYNDEVYNPYKTQYEKYEEAVAGYNAGPRTTDYDGPEEPVLASRFEMDLPTAPDDFSLTSPVLPFEEADVTAYQKKAANTARSDAVDRGVALDVVSDPGKYNLSSMSISNRFMAEGGPVDAAPSGQARNMINQMTGLVASAGRGGDTQLAHLSPQSAGLLKSQGGAGTINPKTGLPQYLVIQVPAERYDEAEKTNFKSPDGRPLPGFDLLASYQRGNRTPIEADEQAMRAIAARDAARRADEKAIADRLADDKSIADRLANEKAARDAARVATEKEAERIYAARVRDQRVANPVTGNVARTVLPTPPDFSYNTRSMSPLAPVDLDNRYIRTPGLVSNRGPSYIPPNPSQQPRQDRPVGPTTLPPFLSNSSNRIPTASDISLPTMGKKKSAITDPKNFFALDPSKPASLPGLLPGTVSLAPLDLPIAAGKKTLEAIAANPNLSPKMLGGQENAGIMIDRLGNRIYSPGAGPLLYRSGGEVSNDINTLLAQNTSTLSDEEPEEAINTNPVGTAQKYLADLSSAGKASPTRQSVKRTKTPTGGGATADKAMQMAQEDLAKGDLGSMKDRAPAAKNTESARSQMEEIARVYQLKIKAAQNAARGLSAATFGAPTLEQPTLTKGKLTKKRFAEGGEAKKSDAEEAQEPGIFNVISYATEASARMFPDQMGQDDQRDAARHMLAAASVAKKFGPDKAEFLGKLHERMSNPKSFFNMLGIREPRYDYEPDLHNNRLGAELASRATSQAELEELVRALALQSQNKQVQGKPWTLSKEQLQAVDEKNEKAATPPEYRADGSPEEGETGPAFVTPKSGKGRKEGEISKQLKSGDAYINMAKGVTELPYDIAGAPMDIAMLVRQGLTGQAPAGQVGTSDYIKSKMTELGIRPAPPADPTSKGFYTAGSLLSNLTNPAGVTRSAVKGAQKTGEAATAVAKDFQEYNRQLTVPGASYAVPPQSRAVTPAPASDLGFYSAAEQAALNLPRKEGSGAAFLNDLMKAPDVKKEELASMGLDEFLKSKPKATREEVQDFIANNRIDVKEVELGGKLKPELQVTRDALHEKYKGLIDNIADAKLQYEEGKISYAELRNTISNNNIQTQALDAQINEINKTVPTTKFGQYQLPGGENYREILLTLPFKEPPMPKGYNVSTVQYDDGTYRYFAETPTSRSQGFKTQEEAQSELAKTAANLKGFRQNLEAYKSSHFNEPNVLAHMRVNDRVDADGKKMLLIEELQSDWHQAGRDKGYAGENQKALLANQTRLGEIDKILATAKYTPEEGSKLLNEQGKLVKEYAKLESKRARGGDVPDAPFKDTWHQLALKRALKYAADNGYDRVGLTTGRQQVERYTNEMRQNVNEIVFEKSAVNFPVKLDTPNIQITASKNGKETFSGSVSRGKFIDGPAQGKTVEEVLGKSMAKQIAEHKQDVGSIKGDDLTIGGEGMKKYYDEIYPAFLAKQAKKYGAQVGETRLERTASKDDLAAQVYGRGETYKNLPSEGKRQIDRMYMGSNVSIRYIDIAPKMKSVVPYAKGGAVDKNRAFIKAHS